MHSLGIVQWNSTRRDHPGNPGGVSGSSPVKASAAFSRRVYLVSTSYRDFLTKNTSLYFRFSSSLKKATLTEIFETAR